MGGLGVADAGLRRGRSASSCSPVVGLPGLSGFVGEFLTLVGHVRGQLAAGGRRRDVRDDLRGRLPAVDVPAGRVRRAVSEFLKGLGHHLTDIEPRRGADAGAAVRAGHRHRPLPGPHPGLHPGARARRSSTACRRRPRRGSPDDPERVAGHRAVPDRVRPRDLLAVRRRRSWLAAAIHRHRRHRARRASSPAHGRRRSSAGPIAGARSSAAGWTGQPVVRRRLHQSTQLTTFLDLLFIVDRRADDPVRARLPRAARPADRGVRGDARCSRSSGAMLSPGSADLLVLFLGLELLVLPGYMLAGFAQARRLLAPRAPSSTSCSARSRARSCCSGSRSCGAITGTTQHRRRRRRTSASVVNGGAPLPAGPGHGPRAPDDGRRLQDRRGAVPLLDAGRVPGLADAGHRLPVGGAQGRRRSR